MTPNSTSFSTKITSRLPLIEKAFLIATVIGGILVVTKIDSTVARIALLGLAATFFLYTYKPLDIQRQEDEPFEFSDLLALMIIPKTLWISCTISALGISFFLFEFGNDGYKKLLTIGSVSTGFGSLLFVIFIIRGVKHVKIIAPLLLRAVPLFFMDIYLLYY